MVDRDIAEFYGVETRGGRQYLPYVFPELMGKVQIKVFIKMWGRCGELPARKGSEKPQV